MLRSIALLPVGAMPLFAAVGLLAFISMLIAVGVAVMNVKFNYHRIGIGVHMKLGALTAALAVVHAVLALAVMFGR